jgi:hypothetical protein
VGAERPGPSQAIEQRIEAPVHLDTHHVASLDPGAMTKPVAIAQDAQAVLTGGDSMPKQLFEGPFAERARGVHRESLGCASM